MKQLPFPDQHHINSAVGWLELGNHVEARTEAEQISALGRTHQDAFCVRWRIAGRAEAWTEAHRLAIRFTRICPSQPAGWIYLSYSLYRLRRPLEAWIQLLPKIHDFPNLSAIAYLLAWYASELGKHSLARRFLIQSKALGGCSEVKGGILETEELDALVASGAVPPEAAEVPPITADRLNPGLLGQSL